MSQSGAPLKSGFPNYLYMLITGEITKSGIGKQTALKIVSCLYLDDDTLEISGFIFTLLTRI